MLKIKNIIILVIALTALFACQKDDYYSLESNYLLTNDRGQSSYSQNEIQLNVHEFKWHLLVDGGFILALSGESNGDSIVLDGDINNYLYNKTIENPGQFIVSDSIPFTYPDDNKEYNILNIKVYKNGSILEVADTCSFIR